MRDINLGIADFFRYKQELNKLARLFVTLSSILLEEEKSKNLSCVLAAEEHDHNGDMFL